MAKPGSSSNLKWTGTKGNDIAHVLTANALAHTSYDGGSGYDTLDLSGITTGGVSVDVIIGSGPGNSFSRVWATSTFEGSWWNYYSGHLAGTAELDGSIINFEKIVGTNFNDYLELRGGSVARVIDGGGGDDAIYMAGSSGSNTAVGGSGSDQLFGSYSSDILVGGTYANGVVTIDAVRDEFEAYAGTILDFNPAVDSLYIDGGSLIGQLAAQQWVNVTTSYGSAAQLQITAGRSITLVGVAAEQMNAIFKGFVLDGGSSGVTSRPGDDFIIGSDLGSADHFIFPSGSGHDELLRFDVQLDTLVFPDQVTWTEVSYHGETSLLGTYDGGHSSVLLIGITAAQESQLIIETQQAAFSASMSSEPGDLFHFA
jgi:hypothetical protein